MREFTRDSTEDLMRLTKQHGSQNVKVYANWILKAGRSCSQTNELGEVQYEHLGSLRSITESFKIFSRDLYRTIAHLLPERTQGQPLSKFAIFGWVSSGNCPSVQIRHS